MIMAMMASMSISAYAAAYPELDDAITLDSGFGLTSTTTPFALSGASANKVVKGVFGKEATDESVLITEGENQAYFYLSHKHGENIYLDDGSELDGYLAIDFNFKLANSDIRFIQAAVSVRQHPLSHQITATSPGYNPFGWNNVHVVYDPTGHADIAQYNGKAASTEGAAPKGTKYGNVTTYLNGVNLGTKELVSDAEGWFNMGLDTILIQAYSGNKTASHDTYIDDVKIYKTDWNEEPYMPIINDGDTYTVEDGKILITDTTSINDVAQNLEDYSAVSVYTNDSLTTKATSQNLSAGNVVVVTGLEDNSVPVYSYYKVAAADTSDIDYLVNANDGTLTGMTPTKFTHSQVAGVGGKASDDKSVMLKSITTTESSSYDGNGYLAFDYTKDNNYFVAEFNYYPVDEKTRNMMIVTNGNAGVTGEYKAELGKWNKVMFYVDLTGETPLAHLFINGVRATSEEGRTTTFDGASKKQIRIGNYGDKTPGNYFTSYIDDIKIYSADTAPTADRCAPALLAEGEGVSVKGNSVIIKSGTTAADLSTADPMNTVRVYKNISCTSTTNTLFDGAVAVVENSANNALNYYEITLERDESVVYQVNTFNGFTKNPVRANKSEIIGAAGKAADDSSIILTQNKAIDNNIYNMYLDIPWGTSTSLDSWDKSDYTGYLVYEFNVLNKSIESIRLGTDQNSPVSCDIVPSMLTSGQWNKVSIVLDYSGGENTGKSFVYVNGKQAGTSIATSDLGAEYKSSNRLKNTLRLLFNGPVTAKDENGEYPAAPEDCGTVYIDDLCIYESTAAPDVAIPALDGKYLDENGRFKLDASIKPSEIETEYTVRTYTDSKFTQLVDENAFITDGNIIVVENENGAISYFIAQAWDGTTVISDKLPGNKIRANIETVSGFAGKAASDSVYKITRTSAEDSSAFIYENWSGSKLNDASKYIVFEANVMAEDNSYDYGFHFATNTHSGVSQRINMKDNNFLPGRWNKVVAVMDIETRLVHTYVNGVYMPNDITTIFSSGTNNAIRLVFYLPNGDCMYIDDYKVYESIEYPAVDEAPEMFEGISEDYVVSNDLIYTTASKTVADIKNLYTLDDDETIAVYTGLDFATKLEDTANVTDGAVVLVTAPNENYYGKILKVIDSIPVPEVGKIKVLGDGNGEFTIVTKANENTLLSVRNILLSGSVVEKHLDFVEGDVVMSFHPDVAHGSIKIFAIDDFASLKPLDKATAFECTLGEAPAN